MLLLLQIVALILTIQNQDYHRSQIVGSTGNFIGDTYKNINKFDSYLKLKDENELLLDENAKLHSLLEKSMYSISTNFTTYSDSINKGFRQKYQYSGALVINNSYRQRNNYLTINKGKINGVTEESGVVTHNGIVGVVNNIGENYSSVISVLNKNLLINAKLKKSSYFGSLKWDGRNHNILQLTDIPKHAKISIGDTITTGGYSSIFPAEIPIGKISYFEIKEGQNYYDIELETFIDYANIKSVYIIKNLHKIELDTIQ